MLISPPIVFSVIPSRFVILSLSASHLQILTYINDHIDKAWYHSSTVFYVAGSQKEERVFPQKYKIIQ